MKYTLGIVEKMTDEELLLHIEESALCIYEYGRRCEHYKKDLPLAFSYYKKAAEMGLYLAFWAIARMVEEEELHLTDEEKVYWYQQAANRKDLYPTWKLAQCYRDGRGIKQDYKKYIELLTFLKDEGYTSPAEELADIYEKGEYGVEQSYEKAFRIYSDFAFGEQRSLYSLYKYACYLYYGLGCKKDVEEAKNFLIRLAKYNYTPAIKMLKEEFDIEIK